MGVGVDGEGAASRRAEAIAREENAAKMRVEAWTLEGKMLVRTQVLLHHARPFEH